MCVPIFFFLQRLDIFLPPTRLLVFDKKTHAHRYNNDNQLVHVQGQYAVVCGSIVWRANKKKIVLLRFPRVPYTKTIKNPRFLTSADTGTCVINRVVISNECTQTHT